VDKSKSRTALITGASRGLGLALAGELAQRGWNLIITARGAEPLDKARHGVAESGTTVRALVGDVADPAHRWAIAAAAQEMGGLNAVVNNAAILGPSPLPALLDYPPDALEEVFRINTVAPLALIQELARQEVLQQDVRVLNISSDAAVEAYEGWGGYGASKAALELWTAVLAAERPDWRVYRVDPGGMRTQMHQDAFPGEDISDRPLPEESVPGLIALLEGDWPSGRYAARRLPPEGVTR
jgi:NAD(P)-dependent dehydrogenase (short-subunit alcohol dehydrogenase family)